MSANSTQAVVVCSRLRPARVWARFESKAVEKLDRYAAHKGITRSGLMRSVIEHWLDGQPDEPGGPPVQSERIYDRSDYMRARIESRERSERIAAMEAAARALREAAGEARALEARFQAAVAALDRATQAIEEEED